jgi:hypothetical protein
MVVVDHHGLFIDLNLKYLKSYHEVNILCQSDIYKSWHQYFVHADEYFEFLLGDLGYTGKDLFMLRHMGGVN